jgi:hypothetical protein
MSAIAAVAGMPRSPRACGRCRSWRQDAAEAAIRAHASVNTRSSWTRARWFTWARATISRSHDREELLVPAEDLAQAALGAVAKDGVADRLGRGDEAGAALRGVALPGQPPDRERPAVQTGPLLADVADVALAAKVLPRA